MGLGDLLKKGLGTLKGKVIEKIEGVPPTSKKPEDDPDIAARMQEVRDIFGQFQKAALGRTSSQESGIQTEVPVQGTKDTQKSKDEEIRDKILAGTGVIQYDDWEKIKDIDCKMDVFLGVDKSRFPHEGFYKAVLNSLLKQCQSRTMVPKRREDFLKYLLVHEFDTLESVIFNMRGLSNDFAIQWLKAGGDYALHYENRKLAKEGFQPIASISDSRDAFYVVLREAKLDIEAVGMRSFQGIHTEFMDELIERNKGHMIAGIPNAIEYFDEADRDDVTEKYLQYCLASITSPEIAKVKRYASGLPGGMSAREVDIFSVNDFPKITPYLGKVSDDLHAKFRGAGATKFADALEKALSVYRLEHSQKKSK